MTYRITRSRKLHSFTLALAAFFALSCGADSNEPIVPTNIERTGDQQLGAVNAPLNSPLTARITDRAGSPMPGLQVTWTVTAGGGSVSPANSVTDDNGVVQATWTLGPTPGQQVVTIQAEGLSAQFTATAFASNLCESTVNLQPNTLCLAMPNRAAELQVAGGSAGAEYVAVPFYDGNLARNAFPVSATAVGGTAVTGPPLPDLSPSFTRAGATGDVAFESQLRRSERDLLRRMVGSRSALASVGTADAAAAIEPAPARKLTLNQQVTFNTNPVAGQECTVVARYQKTGIVRAVSANAAIVEDTENPAGMFTAGDLSEILNNLEGVIRPLSVDAFGSHTDIDGNGQVILFYTVEVNRLPLAQSPFFVGGYFYARDLLPKTGPATTPTGKQLSQCAGSNAGELFYMMAPDPGGAFGPARSTAFVKRASAATLAHEYQHLINASRRLYITAGAQNSEVVWLDEGLSHIAEELAYYRSTGFAPRQNITSGVVTSTQARLDLFDTYQRMNISRYAEYLATTNVQSPYGENPPDVTLDDVQTRGAIWSFLRWAADHRGSGDGDVWNRLVRDATATGGDNLRAVFGPDIGGRFLEWAVANYADDAVPLSGAEFRHPSWNFRSVVPFVRGGGFPIQTFAVGGTTVNFTLVDGGAAYLRFGVPANGSSTVRITSGVGGVLPTGSGVWFIRTK